MLFIYPYLVGFSLDSTHISGTIVDVLIGTGQHSHVSYDCNGKVLNTINYSTVDYGISVTHNIETFKFGARAGGYSIRSTGQELQYPYNNYGYFDNYPAENSTSVFYLNPFIGFENKYFDINFGAVFFSKDAFYGNISEYIFGNGKVHPSWMLRIGNKEKFHFSSQFLSNVPLFSGGGIGDAGFGFGSTDNRNLTWVGFSIGPYQNIGLTIKQNIQISQKMDVLLRGRGGFVENNFEGGISAGLRISL